MSTSVAQPRNSRSLSWGQNLLIASVIEATLIFGSGGLILTAMAKIEPPLERPVEISIEEPEKEKVHREQPKPKSEFKPKPVSAPITKTAVPIPAPSVAVNTPAPSPQIESPIVEAPAPVVPPPPARTKAAAEREAEFAAKVKAAIQAAVVYPPAARSMGFVGRARVEFVLRDGVPGQIKIIQGSGIGMIDRAALSAVANAAYPEVPDSLKGRDQLYQVTVLFELNAARRSGS
jgi:protein TonB